MDGFPKNLRETHIVGPATGEWLVRARQVPSFESTRTRVAGFTLARPGYRFVRISPACTQVLACTRGEGKVWADGAWRTCGPGMAYLTYPHASCAYHVPARGFWEVCWVIYEHPSALPGVEEGRAPRLVRADGKGLQLVIQGLCHEAAGDADPAILELGATAMHRMVRRLLVPGTGDIRLRQLWQAVQGNLGADWNVERMARVAGVSEESLRRLCIEELGAPPLSHARRLRMEFAADLLATTSEKIGAIAVRVGYQDAFAFSSAFKREIGSPPSAYRSRHSGESRLRS